MKKDELSQRKMAELRLIAQLTVEATLATEEKLSRLAKSKAAV
jgi:hypothetical protein